MATTNGNLWNSAAIIRYSQEGENDFADDFPCILVRISLQIKAGVNEYTLPDNIRSIRRISWPPMGWKLDPLPHRNMREVFQYATQQGTPFWYIFNNIGANTIRFFPAPPEDINPTENDLYSDGIQTDVIVEYFRLPDFATYVIPDYFRRKVLKPYVLRSCFGAEGPGTNVKNRDYFLQKYEFLKEKYGELLLELHNKSRKLCLNGITSNQFFPGSPILPVSRFGIGIDDGY